MLDNKLEFLIEIFSCELSWFVQVKKGIRKVILIRLLMETRINRNESSSVGHLSESHNNSDSDTAIFMPTSYEIVD